jgi:hypothetical protein
MNTEVSVVQERNTWLFVTLVPKQHYLAWTVRPHLWVFLYHDVNTDVSVVQKYLAPMSIATLTWPRHRIIRFL